MSADDRSHYAYFCCNTCFFVEHILKRKTKNELLTAKAGLESTKMTITTNLTTAEGLQKAVDSMKPLLEVKEKYKTAYKKLNLTVSGSDSMGDSSTSNTDREEVKKEINELKKNYLEKRRLTIKQQKEFLLLNIIGTILNVAENLFIILFMSYHLMVTGNILIGGFAIAIISANKMRNMFSELQWRLTQINKQSIFADKVRKFLETESKIISGERDLDTFESIEFKNVTFTYQVKEENDSEEKTVYALENVSFKINKGDRIALVGYNGAGKTTITKLMMRLYDVTEGEILINGVNIKEYRLDMLREKIGAVFQDYKVFAATVAENVLADVYTPEKEQTVLDALKDSTFDEKLETLPNGIQTELTKEFYKEGTELSGGESQKIAIARVFAHNNELIVMDEPSSALDPIAEYNLNVGIDKNAKGKTVVFITHRLSTTRHVDMIYMLENGKIIENGSHDDLISQNGKYASMFNLQAAKYKT